VSHGAFDIYPAAKLELAFLNVESTAKRVLPAHIDFFKGPGLILLAGWD